MVEQRSQSAGDDTGCELVVRVEQRDGPVAGWLCSVSPLALVEQGDSALGYVGWQGSCARLEGLAEHGGELWAELVPEALVELIWQAVKAGRLATRQGLERLGEILQADAAIAGCALSLLPLLRRKVQIQCHEELLLRLWRCLGRREEALW